MIRALALGLLLAGCGTAATDGIQGTPVFSLTGDVFGTPPSAWRAEWGAGRFLQAVFWSGPGIDGEIETSTSRPPWPLGDYELNLFGTEPVPGPWAAGRFEMYLDADGDGQRGPDEIPVVGLQFEGLLWARQDLTAAESPTGHPVPAGIHVIPFPMACGAQPAPQSAEPCDLPLGETCTPGSCAGGLCTSKWPRQWTEPTCLVEGRSPACTPQDAVWLPSTETMVWVPACAATADCPSSGQICEPALGACLSSGAPLALARPDFSDLRLQVCLEDP